MNPSAGPRFPCPDELGQSFRSKFRPTEEMHVVRHDDIASDNPPRTVVRQSPFLRKNSGYTLFCQDFLTIFRADRHEVNRRLNPNPIQSAKMLGHRRKL